MSQEVLEKIELAEVETETLENAKPFFNEQDLSMINHMEVELSVDLGQMKMSVEQLYQLKPGQVVKLNSLVNEPLKICFGESIVAEGILVAADDHYAIEITKTAK